MYKLLSVCVCAIAFVFVRVPINYCVLPLNKKQGIFSVRRNVKEFLFFIK